MGCKHCKKDLEHLPGKRKKEFCNDTCRSNFWQKERRKKNNAVKLAKEKKEPEPVVPPEKEEQKEEVKEQPKSVPTTNCLPKTLDQLKALCPPELKGFDRSEWIGKKRQEYGI